MNKLKILIMLLFLPISLSGGMTIHSGGTGAVSIYASGTGSVSFAAGGAETGGGGSCEAGTVLVGTDSTGTTTVLLDPDVGNHTLPFTASATGTPSTGEIYGAHTITANAKIVIYGPTGTKLCESASTSINDSVGWKSVSFASSSCPELSDGTTYTLLFISEGFFEVGVGLFSTWDLFIPAGSLATPPVSITPGTADGGGVAATHPMSIRIKC